MIQQIKIKNFLSFRDETVFNFEASNDNFAEDSQVIKMKDGTRLLRFAIIYGYNASGKSNLVESFDFYLLFGCESQILLKAELASPRLLSAKRVKKNILYLK